MVAVERRPDRVAREARPGYGPVGHGHPDEKAELGDTTNPAREESEVARIRYARFSNASIHNGHYRCDTRNILVFSARSPHDQNVNLYHQAIEIAIPEVDRVRRGRQRLVAHIAEQPPAPSRGKVDAYELEKQLAREISDDALFDRDLPGVESLAVKVFLIRGMSTTAHTTALDILNAALRRYDHREQTALRAGVNPALTWLNMRLQDHLEDARVHAEALGEIRIDDEVAAPARPAYSHDLTEQTIGGMTPVFRQPGVRIRRHQADTETSKHRG